MIRRTLTLMMLMFSLSGCTYFGSYFEVDELNKAQPKGSAFNQALTAQYRERANFSQNVTYHYTQAYRVADRGLLAADGSMVTPYTVDDFGIPADLQPEIIKARAELDKALNAGARDRTPKEAALAQAKFDCWVEDAEKTWQPELYQTCRKDFIDAMAAMHAMRGEPVDMSGTDLNVTNVTAKVDSKANRFLIFFGSSGAKISASTVGSLDQIAQIILQRHPTGVRVEGHSDHTGRKKTRAKVSTQRAAIVSEALIQRGVPAGIIHTAGFADTKSLVQAKSKNVPANRRVEIWLDF